MRITWPAAALVVLTMHATGTGASGFPEGSEPIWLKFDQPMSRFSRSLPPNHEFWKYYITVPDNERDDVHDPKEVARYVKPAEGGDVSACRLLSRKNYVGVFRLVPPGYENARRLFWKWSVRKHPHGGKIGGSPNDQSVQVYALFREIKAGGEESYSALGFVWTEKTKDSRQTIRGRMPWYGSPRAEIVFIALRDSPATGEFAEEVDMQAEYQKAFAKKAPPIWGVLLLADSNEVEPDIGEMTTDGVIRDIRLSK